MFTWKFLELFASGDKLTAVRYLITGKDGTVIVNSEGQHQFSDGIVNKTLPETIEADIVQWIEKDTTVDGINAIKLTVENQLKSLNKNQKVDFPWVVGTFTIE